MKKTLVGLVLLLAVTLCFAWGGGFCEGWHDGYVAGWCYGNNFACIEPLVPMCPLPRIGEDGYYGGYNRGFIRGLNARHQ